MVGKNFISFYGKIWNMAKKLIWHDVTVPETLNIYSFSLNTCTCTYNKWSLFLKHCTELTFTNLLFFLFGTYTQLTDICVIQVTFHIPVIYQSIFLMRCTHKLLFVLHLKLPRFTFFMQDTHNVPLVHASEDLVNLRTCLYLKTLVELKDFSVSKANLYTCLTFCVFVTLSFPDKQVRLIFLSDIHRNNTICDTHPSSKS